MKIALYLNWDLRVVLYIVVVGENGEFRMSYSCVERTEFSS